MTYSDNLNLFYTLTYKVLVSVWHLVSTRYLSIAVFSDFLCGIVIFAEFVCGIAVFRTRSMPHSVSKYSKKTSHKPAMDSVTLSEIAEILSAK